MLEGSPFIFLPESQRIENKLRTRVRSELNGNIFLPNTLVQLIVSIYLLDFLPSNDDIE